MLKTSYEIARNIRQTTYQSKLHTTALKKNALTPGVKKGEKGAKKRTIYPFFTPIYPFFTPAYFITPF